jgi:serine-type D-Ala-D-Ala carboxypeptidase/endopeptidase (penicillin-binding protein 4)
VKGQGITTVQGSLIVDCSEWDMNDLTPAGWAANVRQDYYAPQTSPLTINENLFEIKVRPGPAAGQKPIIEFNPPAEGYPILNNATTGEGGGLSVRKNDRGLIEINGSIGLKAGVKSYGMPCDRPALYAACVFRSHLHKAGVRITGDLRMAVDKRSIPPPTAENTIAMYPSPPMSDMVKTMMKHSNNHFAEQLYVAVSAVKKGKGGYRNSLALENDLLSRAGVNPSEIHVFDGCGLSRMNKVEPHQVTSLLDYMMRHQHAQAFFDSMAISGKDGTLRGRLQGNGTREKVYAKTGFINGVSCLSGYFLLQPQKTIIFSFLVNDVPGSTGGIKSTQDRLLTLLSMLTI